MFFTRVINVTMQVLLLIVKAIHLEKRHKCCKYCLKQVSLTKTSFWQGTSLKQKLVAIAQAVIIMSFQYAIFLFLKQYPSVPRSLLFLLFLQCLCLQWHRQHRRRRRLLLSQPLDVSVALSLLYGICINVVSAWLVSTATLQPFNVYFTFAYKVQSYILSCSEWRRRIKCVWFY